MREAASFIASQNGSSGAGILPAVGHSLKEVYRTWQNRRQVAALAEFDDHMLADIGLTRRDVGEALELPFSSAPGRELQLRASRRHGWNI